MAQVIEPVEFERRWLLIRQLLSALPPLLGLILAIRFYYEEKRKQRDVIFELMAIISIVISSFLTITYVILLLLLYAVGPIGGLSFYFISVGFWGFISISLADSGIFYKSQITYTASETYVISERFSNKSSKLLTKAFGTSTKRLVTLIIIFFLLVISAITSTIFGDEPISI